MRALWFGVTLLLLVATFLIHVSLYNLHTEKIPVNLRVKRSEESQLGNLSSALNDRFSEIWDTTRMRPMSESFMSAKTRQVLSPTAVQPAKEPSSCLVLAEDCGDPICESDCSDSENGQAAGVAAMNINCSEKDIIPLEILPREYTDQISDTSQPITEDSKKETDRDLSDAQPSVASELMGENKSITNRRCPVSDTSEKVLRMVFALSFELPEIFDFDVFFPLKLDAAQILSFSTSGQIETFICLDRGLKSFQMDDQESFENQGVSGQVYLQHGSEPLWFHDITCPADRELIDRCISDGRSVVVTETFGPEMMLSSVSRIGGGEFEVISYATGAQVTASYRESSVSLDLRNPESEASSLLETFIQATSIFNRSFLTGADDIFTRFTTSQLSIVSDSIEDFKKMKRVSRLSTEHEHLSALIICLFGKSALSTSSNRASITANFLIYDSVTCSLIELENVIRKLEQVARARDNVIRHHSPLEYVDDYLSSDASDRNFLYFISQHDRRHLAEKLTFAEMSEIPLQRQRVLLFRSFNSWESNFEADMKLRLLQPLRIGQKLIALWLTLFQKGQFGKSGKFHEILHRLVATSFLIDPFAHLHNKRDMRQMYPHCNLKILYFLRAWLTGSPSALSPLASSELSQYLTLVIPGRKNITDPDSLFLEIAQDRQLMKDLKSKLFVFMGHASRFSVIMKSVLQKLLTTNPSLMRLFELPYIRNILMPGETIKCLRLLRSLEPVPVSVEEILSDYQKYAGMINYAVVEEHMNSYLVLDVSVPQIVYRRSSLWLELDEGSVILVVSAECSEPVDWLFPCETSLAECRLLFQAHRQRQME
ncbi:hypothetical protein HDE_12916 [Halotydeus destructor]|nr:hypothetical protein HDE_12916 [Halotydeus destructor]